MGRNGPSFLAYENFGVYLQWNQSLNYATTAAYLATRIEGAPKMRTGRADMTGCAPCAGGMQRDISFLEKQSVQDRSENHTRNKILFIVTQPRHRNESASVL